MTYNKLKLYYNYALIGLVSIVSLLFFPFIGSEVGMEWVLPNTPLAWLIYVVKNLFIAGVNILIFHCFICQGKINIKDNEKFIEANKILNKYRPEQLVKPRSPKQYFGKTYGVKGTMIIICSVLATISLTEALLVFDVVALLTYGITIFFGFITGVIQMAQVEVYWTEEYWSYAKEIEADMELAKEEPDKQGDADSDDTGGSPVLATTCSSYSASDNQPRLLVFGR